MSDNGPGGYYDFTPGEWFEWALNECEREMIKRNLKTSLQERKKLQEKDWNAVRESMKWCEENPGKDPLDWVKPQTPEQTEQSLKEAFVEAQKTEKWKEIQKKIDNLGFKK